METIDQVLMTYLANALWMTCLIAAAGMLLEKLLHRGPSVYRHALWVMALVCASLVPLNSLRTGLSASSDARATSASGTSPTESLTVGTADSSQSLWMKMRHRKRPIPFAPLFTEILASGYMGFLWYQGLCLFWGWRRTRRILRNASPCFLARHQAVIVERCSRTLRTGAFSIVCSRELDGPAVLGARRQVLVLPEAFITNRSDEELTSALCHELAHVRRHDFLLNLIYEVLCVPISLHPAARLIKKQVAKTRELACDEMAAGKLPTRAVYARSLLNMAQSIASASPTGRSGYALGLFDTNTLEERIMNILRKMDYGDKSRGRGVAFCASALLGVLCLAASAFSFQVARGGSTPEELKQFAGTWEGKFKGKTFITLKLAAKEGKISGTVSRISMQMNDRGELVEAKALDGEDDVAEALPEGKLLRLTTKAKGAVTTVTGDSEESIQYDMRLTGSGQAELQIAGAPPGMPAPAPWKLERKPTNP